MATQVGITFPDMFGSSAFVTPINPLGTMIVMTQGLSRIYRMRGYDGTLAQQVFWNAPGGGRPDLEGRWYTGTGPLTLVVVQSITYI